MSYEQELESAPARPPMVQEQLERLARVCDRVTAGQSALGVRLAAVLLAEEPTLVERDSERKAERERQSPLADQVAKAIETLELVALGQDSLLRRLDV